MKRKRKFEIEKDEKNPLKFRFVDRGGKNDDGEKGWVFNLGGGVIEGSSQSSWVNES